MKLLDANAVLRYMLDDIPEQAEATQEAIRSGAEVTVEVLAECVYVLKGVYGLPRSEASRALLAFLDDVSCDRQHVASFALRVYGSANLDFVDCVLLAESKVNGREVITFDEKLCKAIASPSF